MKNIEESQEVVKDLTAKKQELINSRNAAQTARNALPRSDKVGSHVLFEELGRIDAELRVVRVALIKAEEVLIRRNQHSLWEHAVLTLYGADGLAACRAQMRQEKINRGGAMLAAIGKPDKKSPD